LAVDLGDGIGRHPVQIYEILFLIVLDDCQHQGKVAGGRAVSHLSGELPGVARDHRLLKPQPLIGGLNLIQWSCLAGIVLLVVTRCVEG